MRFFETAIVLILLVPVGSFPNSQGRQGTQIPVNSYHANRVSPVIPNELLTPRLPGPFIETGIKEIVPASLQPKYRRWRAELLGTNVGRDLWNLYYNNPNFLLKVVVTDDKGSGAGTDDFVWNDDGELVGATVFLGADLDRGFPDPVYYPVMNALETAGGSPGYTRNLLASTKMAHELGHVKSTAKKNGKLFQRQNNLIANYYTIFLRNGHKSLDPRLVAIVDELGARPIEIWEDQEYWSEVVALGFLLEKLDADAAFCSLLRKLNNNLANYAVGYKDRFEQLYPAGTEKFCGK